MFRNYFNIAYRNIIKSKVFTLLNVLGLALGICACIVIFLITHYEFSFDSFHPGKEQIYRVMGDVTENTGNKLHFGKLPFGVSQEGKIELTGVEHIAGVIPYTASITIPNDGVATKKFESATRGSHFLTTVIAEPAYLEIFKYQWLAGNPTSALDAPFKVVLTESRAQQYFADHALNDIIGRQVIYDDSLTLTVSGIVKDWDGNTDFGFTDFISSASLQTGYLKNKINTDLWGEPFMNTWTFVKCTQKTTDATLTAQLQALVKRHAESGLKLSLWLEPLTDIHFNADVIENPLRTADKSTLFTLIAIALFILILAIINFINLSTAQSIQRAKEVGVRKVLGCSRTKLVFQFLTESFILTLFAITLAVLFVDPVLAAFRSFIPDGVTFHLLRQSTIIFLLALTMTTSLLAGFYPAKVLSSHLPVLSLKGYGMQRGGEKWLLRKGLIVFQFVVSLIFIIGSIVITKQLAYTREKDPGFNAGAILIVSTPSGDSLSKVSVLAGKIKKIPSVSDVALQWLPPMTDNGRSMQLKFKNTDEKEIEAGQIAGDENFIPLYQIKLLAGRNLQHADSVKELVINESLLNFMGYKNPQEAIGKVLYWRDKPYPVIGVVADFHSASFHDLIRPVCIINRPDRESSLAVKLTTPGKHSNPIQATLSEARRAWKQVYPQATFSYQFYDESLARLYEKDQRTASLVNTAMAVAIFISCLGLLGLVLFATEKRAKEISIRKLLGAGVGNIVILLSEDFVSLVLIAFLIASPIAWYFIHLWLQGFAYRISIGWGVFVIAGVAALLIALLTISFQAIKAAVANPVKSLRTE